MESHVQRLRGQKVSVRFINMCNSLKSLDPGWAWANFRPEIFLLPMRRLGLRVL